MRVIETTDELGRQIREIRDEAGITQSELAELAGLTQSHVSAIEHGQYQVTIPVLRRIGDALDADWGYDGKRIHFCRRAKL